MLTNLLATANTSPYTQSWTPSRDGRLQHQRAGLLQLASTLNTPANKLTVNPSQSATTISNIIGTTISYGGGAGAQFVLLGTNNAAAPLANWPRLATNPTTPGNFTVPATGSSASMLPYRIKSE